MAFTIDILQRRNYERCLEVLVPLLRQYFLISLIDLTSPYYGIPDVIIAFFSVDSGFIAKADQG